MMLVLNRLAVIMGLYFMLLPHVEQRAYLRGDEAQKELCSVALTD